jgi:hypothetical protein
MDLFCSPLPARQLPKTVINIDMLLCSSACHLKNGPLNIKPFSIPKCEKRGHWYLFILPSWAGDEQPEYLIWYYQKN